MKNRLQFNRHFPIFSGETKTIGGEQVWIDGREQAKKWLDAKIKHADFIPLIGEPIVLRYLDNAGNKQLILAVGKATGNTTGDTTRREYHIIDSAELQEGVNTANNNANLAVELASSFAKDIENYRIILQNMIGDGGIEMEDGSYFETDDPRGCGLYKVYPGTNFISAATSFAKADYILDQAIGKTNGAVSELSGATEGIKESLGGLSGATQSLSGVVGDLSANTQAALADVNDDLAALSSATVSFSAATNTVINNITSGAGLEPDGTYEHEHNANYIDDATSLFDADVILDRTIKELSGNTVAGINDLSANTVSAIAENTERINETINNLSAGTVNIVNNLSAGTIAAINDLSANTADAVDEINNDVAALSSATVSFSAATDGLINNIKDGSGLKPDGTYEHKHDANYIGNADSLFKADVILDETIADLSANTISAINNLSAGTVARIDNLSANTINAINNLSANTVAADQAINDRIDDLESREILGEDAIRVAKNDGNHTVSLRISDEDKVLTQNYYGLKANVNLVYDSENKKIYLKGKNNETISEINAADFIKDGMLDTVALITATEEMAVQHPELIPGEIYLMLTFNTDAGKADVFISVKKLVDIYTVSASSIDYLTIEGYEIRANVNVENGLAGYEYAKGISAVTTNIVEAAGLNLGEQGMYPGHDDTHIIKNAHSLDHADVLLDGAIYNVSGMVIDLSGNVINYIDEKTEGFDERINEVENKVYELSAGTVSELRVVNEKIVSGITTLSGNVINYVDGKISGLTGDVNALSGAVINLSAATTAISHDVTALSAGTIQLSADTVAAINAAIDGLDSEASVTPGKYLTGIEIVDGKINGITETDLPELSITPLGDGNVITDIQVNDHEITFSKGLTVATDADLENLSGSVVSIQEELDRAEDAAGLANDGTYIKPTETGLTSGSKSLRDAIAILDDATLELSAATVFAMEGVDDKIEELSGAVITFSSATVNEITNINNDINVVSGDVQELSGAVMSISAKTAGVLTLNLNGVEQGKYCPSASTTIDLTAIQEVTGADVLLTGYEISTASTLEELTVVETDNVNEAFGKVQKQIIDNEEVVAAALNEIDERVDALSASVVNNRIDIDILSANMADISVIANNLDELSAATISMSGSVVNNRTDIDILSANMIDNEMVIAAAFNDVNSRIINLSGDVTTLQQETLTGVSIDGVLQPIVNRVANLEIEVPVVANFFDGAEYDSNTKLIKFTHGQNVVDTIDATDFIKDGMLDSVSVIEISGETYLSFVFNTDSGKEAINIKVSDFAGLYSAGSGISISNDNVVTIKLANKGDTNFLKLDGDGLYLTGLSEMLTDVNSLSGMVNTLSGDVSTLSGAVINLSAATTAISQNLNIVSGGLESLSASVITNRNNINTLSARTVNLSGDTYGSGVIDSEHNVINVGTYRTFAEITASTSDITLDLANYLTIVNVTAGTYTLRMPSSNLPEIPVGGIREYHVIFRVPTTGQSVTTITIANDTGVVVTGYGAIYLGSDNMYAEANVIVARGDSGYRFFVRAD